MRIAVITGASSGLGAELVRQILKSEGIDEIWMIARRERRMELLCARLSGIAENCRLRRISMDLTTEKSIQRYEDILKTEQPTIEWLINCAGFGKMGTNQEIDRKELDDMVLLNVKAAMDMTQVSLPFMRRGGHILEICSVAAFAPLGSLGVYAATKAFLLNYSRSLNYEVRKQGIVVTAVCPYWIRDTQFIDIARRTKNSWAIRHFPFAYKAKTVAACALRDARSGRSVSLPGIMSRLQRLLARLLPHDWILSAWDIIRRI